MNVVDIYKELLEKLKLGVSSNGGIYIPSKKSGKIPLLSPKGVQLFIPQKDVIANMVQEVDGKIEIVKELFNPFDESAINGENPSLILLKDHMEKLLNHSFAILGEIALNVVMNNKENQIEDLDLISFIDDLNKNRPKSVKNLVNENTIKHWIQIYKETMATPTERFLHLYLKRGGKVGKIRYKRITVTTSPVEAIISKAKNKDNIYGFTLSNSAKSAYLALFRFVFKDDAEDLIKGMQIGTENNIAPANVSLLETYNILAGYINDAVDAVSSVGIDAEDLDEARLELFDYNLDKLMENVSQSLKEIPTITDLSTGVVNANKNEAIGVMNSIFEEQQQTNNNVFAGVNKTQNNNNTVQNNVFESKVSAEDAALAAILGSDAVTQNTVTSQQSVFGATQQALFNTPQQQNAFTGVNLNNNTSLFPQQPSAFGVPTTTVYNTPPW